MAQAWVKGLQWVAGCGCTTAAYGTQGMAVDGWRLRQQLVRLRKPPGSRCGTVVTQAQGLCTWHSCAQLGGLRGGHRRH